MPINKGNPNEPQYMYGYQDATQLFTTTIYKILDYITYSDHKADHMLETIEHELRVKIHFARTRLGNMIDIDNTSWAANLGTVDLIFPSTTITKPIGANIKGMTRNMERYHDFKLNYDIDALHNLSKENMEKLYKWLDGLYFEKKSS